MEKIMTEHCVVLCCVSVCAHNAVHTMQVFGGAAGRMHVSEFYIVLVRSLQSADHHGAVAFARLPSNIRQRDTLVL